MEKSFSRYQIVGLYLALALAIFAVYRQVGDYDFITTFDDDLYVVDNDNVNSGLTVENLGWAFTSEHAYNWHPLTWVSHMIDCELYALNAGGHHLTNVFIHIANTLLLLFVLSRMTGNLWSSVFVAGVFGLHPLHVESVAWVSERKDVLSTFFWILTMLFYWRYVRRPGIIRYLPVLLTFSLGLMAKQMLVMLPAVLLLLDCWPLGRFKFKGQVLADSPGGCEPATLGRCVLEKIPLLILSVIASAIVYVVQERTGTVRPFAEYPLFYRIGNALVVYIQYIGSMFWPAHLAIFYPHPGRGLPVWQVGGAVLLLVSITFAAVWKIRRRCYFAVGWFWYLLTLVPVIGLVQVGMQGRADRYTYIPLTGLFIIAGWFIFKLVSRLPRGRVVLWFLLLLLLTVLGVATERQVRYWQDGMTLYRHAAAVVSNNWWAHHHIGELLLREDRPEEAIIELNKALRIRPGFADAHNNLGVILAKQGKYDESISHLMEAVRINPRFVNAQTNLGYVLAQAGRDAEAIKHYTKSLELEKGQEEVHCKLGDVFLKEGRFEEATKYYYEAVRLRPGYFEARSNLAKALAMQGRLKEAIEHWEAIVQDNPKEFLVHGNLGTAFKRLGQLDKAVEHWEQVLRLKPDHVSVLNKLAWLLATCADASYRDPIRAVEIAERGCKLTAYREPKLLDSLAAAYAGVGRFDEAVGTAERALKVARLSGAKELEAGIGKRLKMYRRKQAYYE